MKKASIFAAALALPLMLSTVAQAWDCNTENCGCRLTGNEEVETPRSFEKRNLYVDKPHTAWVQPGCWMFIYFKTESGSAVGLQVDADESGSLPGKYRGTDIWGASCECR